MIVKDWMSKEVTTADVNNSLQSAMRLISENKIGTLPILNKGRLVGIISGEDVRNALISAASSEDSQTTGSVAGIKVGEIMKENIVLVSLLSTLDEVAELLLNNDISGMPVIDENGDIAGIITKGDICRALISLSGKAKREFGFGFQVADTAGSIKEITDIIRSHGGRIASILIAYDKAPEGFRNVYIRIYGIERGKLDLLKGDLMSTTKMLYMFDFLKPSRLIF